MFVIALITTTKSILLLVDVDVDESIMTAYVAAAATTSLTIFAFQNLLLNDIQSYVANKL